MPNKVEVFTQELDKCFTILRQQLVIIKHMKEILSSEDFQNAKIQELDDLTTEINNNLNELSSINREQYDTLSEKISNVEGALEDTDNEITGIRNIVGEDRLMLNGSEPYVDLKTPDIKYSIVGTEEDGLYIYPMIKDVQESYIQYYKLDEYGYGIYISFDQVDTQAYMKINNYSIDSGCDDGIFNYTFRSIQNAEKIEMEVNPYGIIIFNDSAYGFSMSLSDEISLTLNSNDWTSYINHRDINNTSELEIGSDNSINLSCTELKYNTVNIFAYNEVQLEDVEISAELYYKIATTQRLKDNTGRVYTLIYTDNNVFQFVYYNVINDEYVSCIISKHTDPQGKHEISFTGTNL